MKLKKSILIITLLMALNAYSTGSDGSNGISNQNSITCFFINTGSDGSNGVTLSDEEINTGSDGSNGVTLNDGLKACFVDEAT